jgi:hypothetical protein
VDDFGPELAHAASDEVGVLFQFGLMGYKLEHRWICKPIPVKDLALNDFCQNRFDEMLLCGGKKGEEFEAQGGTGEEFSLASVMCWGALKGLLGGCA